MSYNQNCFDLFELLVKKDLVCTPNMSKETYQKTSFESKNTQIKFKITNKKLQHYKHNNTIHKKHVKQWKQMALVRVSYDLWL